MATIIGGNGTGTLDSSLYLLNRNDTTGAGSAGHDEQVYINVSNGNLVIGHLDEYLPSETDSFLTLRTYNSRGQFSNYMGNGWMLSEFTRLTNINANSITLINGDGSQFDFEFEASSGKYVAGGRKANGISKGVDGPGAYQTITYDAASHTYALVQSNQTVLTFDNNGKLLQSRDTNGNTVTYSYDPTAKLLSIQDSSGHQLNFTYQNGNITQIADETGTVFAQYGYSNGKLVSVTDRAGDTTTYDYYTNGYLKSVTLPANAGETVRTLQFTYTTRTDGSLILSTFTDAAGHVTSFNYNFNANVQGNPTGGVTTVTDALGRVTTYTFNADGQITKVTDAQGLDTVYGYDASENFASVMDANGSAIVKSDTTYYRNLRRDYGIVDAGGQGKLVSQLTSADIAALQARYTTTFAYDGNGNLISRTDGSGNVTTYTYTSFNKIASTISADGNALATSDDALYIAKRQQLGYIDSATGLGKTVAQLTVAEKQALLALYTTTYTYDSHQNVTQIKSPGGDLTIFTYDSYGNLTKKTVYLDKNNLTDPSKQQVTQYFYDVFGNNIKTIDAEGNVTFSSFDHFGNRTTQTDGRGNVTTYVYDADNQLTAVTDALGNTTLNFYDAVGNRIAVRDAAGHTVTYLYNADNLLIGVIDPSDTAQAATRTTSYTYDVMGNRTSSTDAEGRTSTYTYDALNRLLTVTTPSVTDAGGSAVSYTSTYGYDGVGNRISFTDNNGNRTDTVYNSNNLLRRVTDASGHITEYAYDANLNQVSIVVGAELASTARQILKFDYDQKNRLITDTDALGNSRHYTYDGANNRLSATDVNGHTTYFAYDRDNRLLTETKPAVTDPVTGQPVSYTVQHQYDANGNQVAVTDENGHTTYLTFDKNNRVAMAQDANGIKTVFTYDSRGNRTSAQIGVQAHVDASGSVVVDSTEGAQVETFAYDEFNQVIAKTDGVGNALVTSDSALYINLRKQLGIVDASTGQGKTVAQLTAADIQALQAQFTERYVYDRVGNATSTIDHLGRTTSFTYDGLNRLVGATDALGQQTSIAYDGNGNVVKRTDALGRNTTYTYDVRNRLIDTTDALTVVTHRSYDAFSNLLSSTAAYGTADARTTQYVYDLNNRLTSMTDALGHTQSYSYDAVGNRLSVTDAKGQTTQFVYDALNRNISIIDPLSFQTRITYDGVGNRLSLIDAKGGITRFTYDAGNREVQMQDAEGRVTTYSYDVRGNRITQTTAYGTAEAETTAYLYDAENHLRQITDAAGNVTTQDFDAVYNRTRATDANGHSTVYLFDALNREIQVTDAAGGVTQYAYDAVGNRLSVTDANGHITSYDYDARDELIRATDATGVQTAYAYDRVGNQVSITHAANTAAAATMTFVYDLDDQLVSQTDALGHTQTYQYDANHNLTVATDALGHTTTYAYDADNRVTSITDALGNVTQYAYDANGNRVQVTDARGYKSTTYYNADNEVVLSVDNNGYATSFSYDHNGNLISQTLYATALTLPLDPAVKPTPAAGSADQTTVFAYDSLNRLVSRANGEGYVTQYVYDAVGNRIQTRQALDVAATQFEITRSYYDAANREVARVSAQGYLTRYQYDALGNRIAQTQYDQVVTIPSDGSAPQPAMGDAGRTTLFAYDADNRLVQQTDALGMVTTYAYDARGNRISMTEAAGTADARTTLYRYDAADRYIETTNAIGLVTHLDLDANGNVLARHEAYGTAEERVFTFSYDANGRVVSQTDPLGVVTQTTYDATGNVLTRTVAAGTEAARTSSFTYDGDGRQVSATDATGTVSTYVYDAAGNQIGVTQAVGTSEARTNSFAYDRANRLISATDALGNITQYQYDGAGNKLTTIQAAGAAEQRQTSYIYDQDNRLVQITDPMGAVTQYEYDAQGNQWRIVDANGGVQINTFDATGHVLTSLSAAGVLTSNSYDARGNLISTTQSFADGSDARTSTYAYDLLNRQIRVTDGEGFSTSIAYDAFGNQISITHGQYLVAANDPAYSAAKAASAFPQTNSFAYDADNRMLSFTDALGNVTSYQYDAVGNRISTTDALGHTTQYSYDLLNRLTQTITPTGGITRYTYDRVGNKTAEDQLQSGTESSGVWQRSSFVYDDNGRLTAMTDALGIVTQYAYDAMGNLISQTTAAGAADARTVHMEYDLDNRKTADVDALGHRTSYDYDATGNRIKVTDALGNVAHYYYDGANQLKEVVDPQGIVNTFTYDAAGNRTQTRVYMTPVTGTIDDLVAPTTTASSADRISTQQYDRANRLIAETAPDGSVTQYVYDGAGNKITEIQFANTAAPRVLHFVYDADNRLTGFTDVDGAVTSFTYDQVNNKTSQTITSATDPNHTRTTTYAYDANNREISEVFDPAGLNIVQSFSYDHVGNVVSKTDGNGHTSLFTYDLGNRQIAQTDALGNTASFTYDLRGNRIAATDARGNTTNYVYDANDRLLQEIQPSVQNYTVADGFSTSRPTTTHVYDAAGNEVQTIDANGGVTTSYYDGNARLIAQISADNVLTTYVYNAAGDKTSQTLHMTRLTASAHDPDVAPSPPAGESRLTTFEYDSMGRLTLTTYPPAEITTLVNANTADPSAVTVTQQVTERNVYDAYGNLVESYDRNGNRTLNYYDAKGQPIATVDAAGYLTQWDYDQQGNVIEQRVYAQALNTSALSSASQPSAPAGEIYVTNVEYDAASRRVTEIAPEITVFDPTTQTSTQLRPTTTYTYDEVGNQLTKTLGAGTSQAVTEYSYYDANNRRIAVIDGGRVLSTYSYDANGNLVAQKRYINTVPAGVDLTQLSGATNFAALVTADASADEETDFVFDALNRETQQTDVMSSGNLTKTSAYDALDKRTYTQDEDGYVTRASYDAMGRIVESISPDGSGTQYQYDAAGSQILAYTGIITGGPPTPATNLAATLSEGVTLTWTTQGSNLQPQQTWVVYDTVSHQNISDYANRTATQVSTNGQGEAVLSATTTGTTLYVRVVTQDGAGNQTWTAEEVITVPPRFTAVSVAQPNATTVVITAQFDAGITNPKVEYGPNGNLNQSVNFVLQGDGSYQATLSGLSSPGALSYALRWQDASGSPYSSATSTLAAEADQVGVNSTVTQSQYVSGANTTYSLAVSTQVPSSYATDLTALQAQWRIAGSGNAYSAAAVTGASSGQGYKSFDVALGDTTHLDAGTYEIVLTGIRDDGSSVELDHFTYTVGASATTLTRAAVSWDAPAVGSNQLVIIGGEAAASTRDDGRIVVTDGSTASSVDYAAFYGDDVSGTHTVEVTSAANATSGRDVTVEVDLTATEVANISGSLHLAWRAAGSGTSFANDVVLSSSGSNSFSTTLSALAAGEYDFKLYYVDAQGHQVIVEWQRIDATVSSTSYNGHSLTVLAQESGGTLSTNAQGVISVAPGVYTGALDIDALSSSLALSLTDTGNTGGSLQTDGRSTGYYVETQYNALGYKIASNEGDGLWRTFGVDGNGNTVQTNLLGDRSDADYNAANAITTFTAYDARNRKVASFGAPAPAPVAGSSGLTRAVERYAYNVLDQVTAHTDAMGNTTQSAYNALGTQISQTDAYGAVSQVRVDQFGRTTAEITALGHTSLKFYDLQGRLIKERDALGNETTYTFDSFDRETAETDARGYTTSFSYDQRDRLTSQTNALGNSVSFAYDGRNNRISTLYPEGQRTDEVYDSLGRVIDTQVFLDGVATHSQRAYDAYGNLIAETDAMGRVKTHVYGAFGQLLEDIDEDGNIVAYGYDVYGRRSNEYDPTLVSDPTAATNPSGGKDIQKTYDAAGRVASITDLATGVSTVYTYDAAGRRITEVISTPGNAHNRNISYEYDALGQLVSYSESVTGLNFNKQYDAEGNLIRVYTDTGYDPLGQNTASNPNYRYIDHVYTYDAARRVTQEVQRSVDASGTVTDTILNAYTYDAAGNRTTWNNAGVIVSYSYDAIGQVTAGDYYTGADFNQQQWTYDDMGNVLSYTTLKNGSQESQTVSTYNDANRVVTSNKDGQATTNYYDASLRVTQTVLQNEGKTYYYNYSYYGDGRERSVTAYGSASGSSVSTYDVNNIRVRVDLGQGDGQDRPEYKTFVADNEGHILYEYHDDGSSALPETREFIYANGNPVGEIGADTNGQLIVELDVASYAALQNLSDSNPGSNLTYTVKEGDTLQGIALQMYGNASLWFVIADANGLSAGEALKAGTQLLIPNTIKSGTLTADNHKVYSESEIVGSTLPNLKTPPPPKKGGCGSILATIIVIVIAIVIAVVTWGAGSALSAALISGTGVAAGSAAAAAITLASFAVVGAVVAAVGSIVQQGLFIALGYQEKFSWKSVGHAAIAGAISGAASGVGAFAQAASAAGQLSTTGAQFARVASAALRVTSQATQQLLDNGKITNWTGLVAAGIGGYSEASNAISKGANSLNSLASATDKASFASAAASASKVASIANYVTPWANLAETSIRNDGKLQPADWANAVGSTLSQAVTEGNANNTVSERLSNAGLRLGTNALVAGALSRSDKAAAQSYFESSVGNEAGQFIGQSLAAPIQTYFGKLTESIERKNNSSPVPTASAAQTAARSPSNATVSGPSAGITSSANHSDVNQGVLTDAQGNPTGPIPAVTVKASEEEGFLSRTLGILSKGVEALTDAIIGAKELAFGSLLAPLNFVEGLAFGSVGGYLQSRRQGSGILESLGVGLATGAEAAVGGFAMGLSNAVEGATFRLRNLDKSNLSFSESLSNLVGEIPLVGHFLSGGNTPDAASTGRTSTAISQGIHALDVKSDDARNQGLYAEVGQIVNGTTEKRDNIFQTTYPYGSIFDVGFSLLGLSNGYAYSAAQQILDHGVGAGDTLNLVAHSGGVQRLAMASRILGDYDVYGNGLFAIAGPALGSFNNLNKIGQVGSTGLNEPTSVLQYATHSLVSAGGDRANVSYENLDYQGETISHRPPILYTGSADRPYFEYLDKFLRENGTPTGQ